MPVREFRFKDSNIRKNTYLWLEIRMRMDYKLTVALIYDFDGTLSPGNMQEYDFIPAVGKSNREFWNDANMLAEQQDADLDRKSVV